MKIIISITAIALVVLSMFWGYYNSANPVIIIKTELGDINVELYEGDAPVTAAVTLSNQPGNDIKIEVIQGGLYEEDKMFAPIQHEPTVETGILHKNGVISMARNEPGSATSEFFICVGDQPELDYGGKRNPDGQGFAAFGKVISGMDVVLKIHVQPDSAQALYPRIGIIDIIRKE